MSEDVQHYEGCTCEKCFRKTWAIARVSARLLDMSADEVEDILARVTGAERDEEREPAAAN